MHMNKIHRESRPHKCTLCNFSAMTKHNLRQHIDGVHKRDKYFECQNCNYTTVTQKYLTEHLRSAHNNAKFNCRDCHSSFTNKDGLNRHSRVHATSEKHLLYSSLGK